MLLSKMEFYLFTCIHLFHAFPTLPGAVCPIYALAVATLLLNFSVIFDRGCLKWQTFYMIFK